MHFHRVIPNVRTVLILINIKAVMVAGLAVVATAVCRRYGVTADFPLTLIAIAIVFPIVFSIGGAYKRREAALDDYGSLKAHGCAIYFAARDRILRASPWNKHPLLSYLLPVLFSLILVSLDNIQAHLEIRSDWRRRRPYQRREVCRATWRRKSAAVG